MGDYESANSWCLQLVKGSHREGWQVCAQLGRCRHSKDLALRAKFLDFALTYASFEHLEELLVARNEVELSLLYSRVSDQIEPNMSIDSDDCFEDARSESDEDSIEEWQDPRPESPPPSFASPRNLLHATKNVLSVTAASTSSLVSTVANKRMWRNAVGWLRPLRKLPSRATKQELCEVRGNHDFSKQGTHAFYADLCPEAHISQLGTNYKSYALPSLTSPALDVSFTLLRIALIEEALYESNNSQNKVTVLQEIVKGIIQEDLLLGISFLLILTSPQDVHDLLSSFPSTDISLQICLYYYALRIYTILYPRKGPGISSVFLHAPTDVIISVRSIVNRRDATRSSDLITFMEYFRKTDEMVSDYIQGQALQRLNAGIDIERFLSDFEYKKDTLLGLAMSADEEVIGLSLALAKKYEVPLWDVYMTHLQFLFDSTSDISTNEIESLVDDRNIITHLKEKSAEFVTTMEKNVFHTINGQDHDRFALYFTLMAQGCNDEELQKVAEIHLKLLTQIKEVAPSLDYRALLAPDADALEILQPILNQENVEVLAQAAQEIPKEEGSFESSRVYYAWAQKDFFRDSEGKLKISSDWIKRFYEIQNILKKMKAKDVTQLIKSFALSEEAMDRIPLEARKEIVKMGAKSCSLRSQESQDESEKQPWLEASLWFAKLERHLELVRSETFRKLATDPNPKLREYAHQFMLSAGEPETLEKLSRKVLLDLCSFDVLRSTLAVFPEEITQVPEDIFIDVLKLTLANLAKGRAEAKLIKDDSFTHEKKAHDEDWTETHCRVLSHLLKELRHYSDEGGDVLDEEEVLDEIRQFTRNQANPLTVRVRALSIAKQFLPLNDDDQRLLQMMQTGGIVRDAFSAFISDPHEEGVDSLESSAVDTEEGRLRLLHRLVEEMDSLKKAESIKELLIIWPKFEAKTYASAESNPWVQVCLKLLTNPILETETEDVLNLISSSIKHCLECEQITDEGVLALVEKLVERPEGGLKCAIKIALRSSNAEAKLNVIEKYKCLPKAEETHYDTEILELIVENHLSSKVIPTCLYGPLVTFLNEEGNTSRRRAVVEELNMSSYWLEAASLAILPSSIPRSLKTASTALKSFQKWL